MKTKKPENGGLCTELKETLSVVFWALLITFVMRTFIFQPFHIPSGSMQPTLVKGDYVITTKYSLGFGKFAAKPFPFPVKAGRLFERGPERGDVIVFRPKDIEQNFIKRVVGLPGDEIQMRSGRLYINNVGAVLTAQGTEIRLDSRGREDVTNVFVETLPPAQSHKIYDDISEGALDSTETYIVPAGHYFMMGDNRDHSADSRVAVMSGGAGLVPSENLIGKARFVLLSVNADFSIFKPWTWYHINSKRLFKGIE